MNGLRIVRIPYSSKLRSQRKTPRKKLRPSWLDRVKLNLLQRMLGSGLLCCSAIKPALGRMRTHPVEVVEVVKAFEVIMPSV